MADIQLSRRRFLTGSAVVAAAAPLSGCFDIAGQSDVRSVLEYANSLTYRAQRLLLGADSLATEFSETEIRQPQRPNGSTNPQSDTYLQHVANDFKDYRLTVTGLVERPLSLSLAEIRNMPARTQITRHDCVEGWSCIAKWTGTPLGPLLDAAGVKSSARFVVFHCFDTYDTGLFGPVQFYGSIDLVDAHHGQTILAYGLNDAVLPVPNGAPLRVRVERQLGYKMSKYIAGIELVDSFAGFGQGRGGYWEDSGYDWYAGI